VQVHEKERELARKWERKHGRAPTSRELLHIVNDATLQSRKGKDAGPVDWDALAQRWDATLGGDLAGIAPAVSNARGPDTQVSEHHGGGPYRRLSTPTVPISIDRLPDQLQAVARLAVFPVDFADEAEITIECVLIG
jgi:hypothetical protein